MQQFYQQSTTQALKSVCNQCLHSVNSNLCNIFVTINIFLKVVAQCNSVIYACSVPFIGFYLTHSYAHKCNE